ncbi:hypothetical protein IL306_007342 [Fusarium sp. DS 682]|nr:hypothetical protein IL306_007342 [Fusarium sp. DS 682]
MDGGDLSPWRRNRVGVYEPSVETELKKLYSVSPDFVTILNFIRSMKAMLIRDKETFFRLDPICDTLKIHYATEVRRLFNNAKGKEAYTNEIPVRNIYFTFLRSQSPPKSLTFSSMDPFTTISRMPFLTDLPALRNLPRVLTISLAIEYEDSIWDIEGFQMHGPDVVGARHNLNHFAIPLGYHTYYPHSDIQAAAYFCERGIPAHTGLKWNDRDSTPIGFHGYSQNYWSRGGRWAGFRYLADTQEVWFAALHWEDVQQCMESYSRDCNGHRYPAFIARIWVFRTQNGRAVEPDDFPQGRCWIKVKKPEEGDPRWVGQIARTWKMIRYTVSNGHELNFQFDSRS